MIRRSMRESDFHNAGWKANTRPLPKKKSLFPLTLVAITAKTLGAGDAWGGPQVTTATPRATVSKTRLPNIAGTSHGAAHALSPDPSSRPIPRLEAPRGPSL